MKWSKNSGAKEFIVTFIFLRIITVFINKSDIALSVFISLDQNLMRLKKRS